MKCTPKVGDNFWRYTFFMSKLSLKKKQKWTTDVTQINIGEK